ncbi:hypothetical protein P5V15_005623 [Pogonomyrmex californicus]
MWINKIILLKLCATGLKDLKINVPAMVRSGDTVTLSCNYDLEGLPLYTIQWFFNDVEFYRFVPDRKPEPYSTFGIVGVHVNVSKSNTNDVTLVDVSRELTGSYKCEVSAGSPSYHTMIEKAKMEVADAPKTDPVIRTEKERIAVGETLRANCTSGKSWPTPAVTWRLNGVPIMEDNMQYKIWHSEDNHENNTKSAKSFIEFRVTNSMFQEKRHLHLRCTAFIADIYRKSVDIEITEDMPTHRFCYILLFCSSLKKTFIIFIIFENYLLFRKNNILCFFFYTKFYYFLDILIT